MNDSVKSAARIFALLELFDRHQAPLSLRQIVEETGFPQSSTAALLATMVRSGYMRHDRRAHQYAPTRKTTFLGAWVPHPDVSEELELLELLDQLHARTGETAVIAAQDGNFVRYLHVKQARRPIMHHTQAGVLRPLCRSACGLALLSLMDDEALSRTVARLRRDRYIRTPICLREVREQVENTRRYGFAVSRGLVYDDIGMVAIPITVPVRARYIALGVGGPVNRLDAQLSRIVNALRAASDAWMQKLSPAPTPSARR